MLQQRSSRSKQTVVVAVSGSGLLRSHLTGKELPLKARLPLFVGDRVRSTGGIVTLSLYGKTVQLKRSSVWFRFIPPPTRFPPPTMGRAGRPKGLSALLSFFKTPVVNSVVWPERFRLQWEDPLPAGRAVRVRVCAGGEAVWPPPGGEAALPAAGNELISDELRKILREKQRQNDKAEWVLQWTEETAFPSPLTPHPAAPGKIEGNLRFHLLPLERERRLKSDLANIGASYDPLTQLLYQARLFEEYGLAAEAADDYEAAARQSPERADLKDVALRVLHENGMRAREARLQREIGGR